MWGERITITRDNIHGWQDKPGYMKHCYNPDPSIEAVRLFEEKSVRGGRPLVIKDASRYAGELGLKLECPEPMCVTDDGKEVNGKKVKGCITKKRQEEVRANVNEEKWQAKMISNRWIYLHLEQGDCFAWLSCWTAAPTHVVVSIEEPCQQLFPTIISIIERWGQVEAEREGVECVERQQRVSHIS